MIGQPRLTLILINLAGMMEKADEVILPAVYKEVGDALHATPTQLGSLSLFRAIVQTLCYPLAAYMSLRHDRAFVIALGAFLWAAATFFVAISETFLQVAVSRGLNGIGLALVIPSIQSLIADSTDSGSRGEAFGWLGLAGNLGNVIGNYMAISLAPTSFMGIDGWRLAFHLVALISVVVGILVWFFAVDPHFRKKDSSSTSNLPRKSVKQELQNFASEAKAVMKVPTFQILIAQGVSGSFPWSALSFVPMWLELVGFSNNDTAMYMTLYLVSSSIGALFGGKMGDIAAKYLPNAGRIIMAQISSGSFVPLSGILFLGLSRDSSNAFGHVLFLIVLGFMVSWNGAATNNPIFAEIVPEKSRTSIYALDRSLESIVASFAPTMVGYLAEHYFGYKPAPTEQVGGNFLESDRENAESLAKALFTTVAIPIALCCFIYSFMYCTYPRDRERAQMTPLLSSEIQQEESDYNRCGEE